MKPLTKRLLQILENILHPSTTIATAPVRYRGDFAENYPTILQTTDRDTRQYSYIHHSSPSRFVDPISGFVEDPSTHEFFAIVTDVARKGDLGCFLSLDYDPCHGCYDPPIPTNDATDEQLDYVAIKRLKWAYVAEHQDQIIKEIQCLSSLGDGMHVIPLKEALIDDQSNVYIVTQYCTRGSLVGQLLNLPTPINPQEFMQQLEADAKTTYRKMLQAVEYIHRSVPKRKRGRHEKVSTRGIAHCNIQPDHFLLDDNDSLLLTNFAMSQEIPLDNNGFITIDGLWPSTSNGNKYIPPEMAPLNCTFSPVLADVWACTVILFNILTGGKELYLFPSQIGDNRFRFFLARGALWWNAADSQHYFGNDIQANDFLDREVISIYNNYVRFFSPELKKLFKNVFMVRPEHRWGIRQILESDWMLGLEQQGGNGGQPLPPIPGEVDQQEQDSEEADVDMMNILHDPEDDTPSPEPLGDQAAVPQPTNTNDETSNGDSGPCILVDDVPSVVSPIVQNCDGVQETVGTLSCAANGCINPKMKSYPHCKKHNCTFKRCTNQKFQNSKFCAMHKCVTEGCKGNRRYANKYCSECHLKRHVVYGTKIEGADMRTVPAGCERDAIQGGNKSEGGDVPDFSRGDIPNRHEGNQRLVEMGRDLAERNPPEAKADGETKEQEKQRKNREMATNSTLTEKLLHDYRDEGRRFIFCLDGFKTDLKGDGQTASYCGWHECIEKEPDDKETDNKSNYAARQRCGQLIRDARNPEKYKAWKINGRLEEQRSGKRKTAPVDLEHELEELARLLIQDNPDMEDATLAAKLRSHFSLNGGHFLRLRGAQREWVDCSDDLALVRCRNVIRRVRFFFTCFFIVE